MSGKGRSKSRRPAASGQLASAPVAHSIDAKARTEDVLNEDNRHRDFASMMLSEPVLKGLKYVSGTYTGAGFVVVQGSIFYILPLLTSVRCSSLGTWYRKSHDED